VGAAGAQGANHGQQQTNMGSATRPSQQRIKVSPVNYIAVNVSSKSERPLRCVSSLQQLVFDHVSTHRVQALADNTLSFAS
jgi:hypothetical protein